MQRLRGIYKLTKKEILTVWEAEYPLRAAFSYVATRELLRRDAGIATSRRRKMGTGRGKVRVCHKKVFRQASRRIWPRQASRRICVLEKVKRSKGQKSHLIKVKMWKGKSESEKVKVKRWTRWMVNWVNQSVLRMWFFKEQKWDES